MVQFLPQAQIRTPQNLQLTGIDGLGDAVAQIGINREAARKEDIRAQDLANLAVRVRSGASNQEIATQMVQSGDQGLAALGLQALRRAQEKAADRAQSQANSDRNFGLAQRGLALKEDKATREQKIANFFIKKLIGGRQQGSSFAGSLSQSSASPAVQEAALLSLASGDVRGASKLIADAELNSPRAIARQAEGRELGKGFVKQRNQLQEAGQRAQKRLFTIEALERSNAQATTGAFSGARLTAGRVMAALGVDPATLGINPNLPASEFMNSQSLNVVLDFVSQTKGAISEREMDTFASASPGLQNSQAGNAIILRVMRTVAEREKAISAEVGKLGIGEFSATRLAQIQQQVQQAIPFPSLTIQDADAGGGKQSELRELLLEKQRRQAGATQAAAVGF